MTVSHTHRIPLFRTIMRWVLATLFTLAGFAHLLTPEPFVKITPDWVPFARQVILATGLCEIVGAAALMTRKLRPWAGVALAFYAFCVWPANFKQAFEGIHIAHIPSSWWYHGPRLALQPVIIWWALFSGDVIDWPFHRSKA